MDLLPSRREEPLRLCSLVVGLVLAAQPVGLGAAPNPGPQAPAPPSQASHAAALRAKALELGYNLDHEQALETFKESIAADPDDPAGYRLAAATIWITLLFEQGVITVEDYLGQARADVARSAPRPELAAQFHDYLQRARTLAERRFRERPGDADAHFQVGAAFGFDASYTATVEGRVLASVGSARRAFAEHGRVLELNPARSDAGLIVGMYRCAVAELSGLSRLFAFLSGFRGDCDLGLRLVADAARYPSEVRPNALFTLVLLYNRVGRYDDALDAIRELQARYPRNRLLRLEAGGTALRAKRPGEAREWLEAGLEQLAQDPRPKAPGEEARWRYTYGAALAALKDTQPAERELHAALNGATRDWLRGRIHRELGKLADLSGDRPRARGEYEQAIRLCRQDKDSTCADEARTLIKTPHR